MTELQRIVDALGRRTKRAVAVHDRQGRILAYSSHEGHVDPVRAASILTRRAPAESLAWSRAQGFERAEGPMRVAANPELGMESRVCAPARFEGKVIAFVWLVDPDEELGADDLAEVARASDAVAAAVNRERLVEEIERGRERELLRDLCSEQESIREQAADELTERELLTRADLVTAFVVRPVRKREPMGREDTAIRDAVERGLERGRSMAPPRQAATLVRHDHGLLVLGLAPRDAQPVRLAKVAADLQRAVVEAGDGTKGWRVVVGIGEPQKNPVDLHVSYRRARQAADVAGLLESFASVTGWWELGVYQTLLDLPLGTLTADSLHPGLRRLLAAREGTIWLQTLEAWFDLGCDARAAAEQLGLQRGSLYHRLNRIEQLAQVDLSRGDDRLALHLGLKIGRLAGLLG
jgi:hypothetical protein